MYSVGLDVLEGEALQCLLWLGGRILSLSQPFAVSPQETCPSK